MTITIQHIVVKMSVSAYPAKGNSQYTGRLANIGIRAIRNKNINSPFIIYVFVYLTT